MKDFSRRIKRLEHQAVVAASQASSIRPFRLTLEQLEFIHADAKAIDAARRFAEAYAAQAQSTANWAARSDPNALMALAIKTNPEARAAWDYFGGVYRAAVAATTGSTRTTP